MSKRTTHDMICEALEREWWTRLPKRNKYTMFARFSQGRIVRVLFVGRNGALRVSSRANAASSVPVTEAYKAHLLAQ